MHPEVLLGDQGGRQASDYLLKTIYEKKIQLQELEEEHRKKVVLLETEINTLTETLRAMRGQSPGKRSASPLQPREDVAEQVIARNGHPKASSALMQAITAGRELDAPEPLQPPPIPAGAGSPGRPNLVVTHSLDDAAASLTHGACGSAYTISLTATGKDPFLLTHMHSDTNLFALPDVRAARRLQEEAKRQEEVSLWGVSGRGSVDGLASVSPKKEIVKLFQKLSEADKRGLLHQFAERFWEEFQRK